MKEQEIKKKLVTMDFAKELEENGFNFCTQCDINTLFEYCRNCKSEQEIIDTINALGNDFFEEL